MCTFLFFFFQAEDGIRDVAVTGVQTCALPIYVLRADHIRSPERLVKILAVPAAKLGRAVIDVIEWTTTLEDALQLSKLAHVAARVQRHFNVSTQTETNLIRLVMKIARDDMVTAAAQFRD